MAVRVRHDLHRLAGRRVRGGTLRGGLGLLSWGLLARSRRRLLLVVIRVGTVLLSVSPVAGNLRNPRSLPPWGPPAASCSYRTR